MGGYLARGEGYIEGMNEVVGEGKGGELRGMDLGKEIETIGMGMGRE